MCKLFDKMYAISFQQEQVIDMGRKLPNSCLFPDVCTGTTVAFNQSEGTRSCCSEAQNITVKYLLTHSAYRFMYLLEILSGPVISLCLYAAREIKLIR